MFDDHRPRAHAPVLDDDPDPTGTAGGAAPLRRGPAPRLLVVDDDPSMARLFAHLARCAGAAPTVCQSAGAALARTDLSHHAAALVDVHLPDIMGPALVLQLRAAGLAGPIVAVSADDRGGARSRMLQAGADTWLAKPVAPSTVLAALTRLLAPR